MKKLFTFFTAATFLATAATAQRNVDLAASVPSISPNLVGIGESFSVSGVITNAGVEALKSTDSIFFMWSFGGAGLDFTGSGQPTIYYRTGVTLNPGDTLQANRNLSFSSYAPGVADSTKDWCLHVLVMSRGADPAADANTANNDGCHPLTLKAHNGSGGGSSIHDYVIGDAQPHGVSLYPNPARDQVNLNLEMQGTSPVSISIMDITGKLVYEMDYGKLPKGAHVFTIPTTALQNGLYLYRVNTGNQSQSGKLTILK